MTKLSHKDLVNLDKVLGYPSMEKGVCRGFSCMWAQAVLAQDEASFFDRLDFIGSYARDFDRLRRELEQAREQVKSKKPLDERSQKLLQILLFYDGMQLYLNPAEYKELFRGEYVLQGQLTTIYLLAKSTQLEQIDLSVLLHKPYAFTRESLTSYLNQIAGLVTESQSEYPILLGGTGHSVCLKYNKDNHKWHYLDTNNFKKDANDHRYVRELSVTETVESIFQSLKAGNHAVFTTTVLTSATQDSIAMEEGFLKFHENYPMSANLSVMYNRLGVGILYLSCKDGHLAMVQELIKQKGIDINKAQVDSITPLWIACQNGYLAIVQELVVQEKIDINKPDKYGITPLYIVCQDSNELIVELLLEQKA
ncbi:ankyrin repeat-containing protein [Legionella beliardensis]|uniref:Ankyrin repeat-containing protein n=1 Tax=Legionella beliardensis TaxID=91822 RepID=A0A378I060_9GAMM|nr:ankyrin repeat domain-containing protein [Legionella beliardensis]STX27956.1 ankyrin repeat-containing protein [Legionella beliardensis]